MKPLELFPPRLKPSYRRTHFSRGACGFVVARSVRWLDQDPAQVGGDYCEKIRPLRGRLAWLTTLSHTDTVPGIVTATCAIFAAASVDFPLCRPQFRITRVLKSRNIDACFSSGPHPNRSRANRTASNAYAHSLNSLISRLASTTPALQRDMPLDSPIGREKPATKHSAARPDSDRHSRHSSIIYRANHW